MRKQEKDHLTEQKKISIDDAAKKEVLGNIWNWLSGDGKP